jgi:hypothetical protein
MERTAIKFTQVCGSAFMVICLSGCAIFGGGGSDIQRVKDYSLQTPTDWVKADAEGESDEAYRLPSGSIATVTSSCGRNSRQSPEILTKQLLIGARQIQVSKREKLFINEKGALRSLVNAKLDGVPFNLDIIVVASSPCAFDFSLVSPKPIPDVEREQFVEYAKSLKYGTN